MTKAKVGDTVLITHSNKSNVVCWGGYKEALRRVVSVDNVAIYLEPNGFADHGNYEIISNADQSTPPHYAEQNGVACIDAIRAQLGRDGFIAFCRGNIAKYNWRLLQKGSVKADADKLADYARMLAKELEE